MSNYFGSYFGDSSASGGTYTDPGVANVRLATGYTYNGVSQTGTLALPGEADVRSGTTYGAGGTEFTGTLAGGSDGSFTGGDRATLDAILARLVADGATVTLDLPGPDGGGVVRLVRGDGYYASEDRAVSFESSVTLDLAAARSVTWTAHETVGTGSAVLASSPAAVTGSAGAWHLSAEVTEDQTAQLARTEHGWKLACVLANGHPLTLATGTIEVTP